MISVRNRSIDTIKFFAIVCVIIIHIGPFGGTFLGDIISHGSRFAVPYFFIFSGFFFYKNNEKFDGRAFQTGIKYCVRLLYVYLFWYAAYIFWPFYKPSNWQNILAHGVLVELVQWSNVFVENFLSNIKGYVFLGGPAYHLWFLPALACAILMLSVAIKFDVIKEFFFVSLGLFVVAILAGPYKDSPVGFSIGIDTRNGPLFSAFFVFIGAVLAKYDVKTSFFRAGFLAFFGLLLSLFEIFLIKSWYQTPIVSHNFVVGTIPYALGVSLVALSQDGLMEKLKIYILGRYTLGIYAIHIIAMWLLIDLDVFPENGIFRVVLTLISSTVFVLGFSRIPTISIFFK